MLFCRIRKVSHAATDARILMKIHVTREQPYQELTITEDNFRFKSGLLNREDRRELAKQLIDAAGDLLVHDEAETYAQLTDIFNQLSAS